MANSNVPITAGTGTNIDTRTAADGDQRQVMVIGDDGTNNTATMTTAGTKQTLDVNIGASAGGNAVVSGTFTNAANSAVSATVSTSGNITAVLVGGTYTLLPIIFEASVDGTNWFAVDGTQVDGTGVNVQLTLPSQSSGPKAWNFYSPGYTNFRVRMTATAGTFTTSPTVYIAQGPFLFEASPTVAPIDGQKWSYSVAVNPTGTAGIANIFDQWNIGNPAGSGRTMRITRARFGIALATAAAGTVSLIKRSAANTGGTQVTIVRTAHDSANAATIATGGGTYSAAPTALGTAIGTIRQERLSIPVVTAAPVVIEWTFDRPSQAIILRPGEYLGLTVGTLANAAAGTAPTVTGDVEWTEE